MVKHLVTLYRTKRGWVADFGETPEAGEFNRLLGTARVPTPYLARVDADKVRRDVQERNPQYHVVVAEEDAR